MPELDEAREHRSALSDLLKRERRLREEAAQVGAKERELAAAREELLQHPLCEHDDIAEPDLVRVVQVEQGNQRERQQKVGDDHRPPAVPAIDEDTGQ